MPAPKRPNTTAATAAAAEAARRRRDTRAADWLRSRGWTVTPPHDWYPDHDQRCVTCHLTDGACVASPAARRDVNRLNAAVEKARHLNGPMVARLRKCAADTSPNWDGAVTVYPPEARGLVDLIDTLSPGETNGKG